MAAPLVETVRDVSRGRVGSGARTGTAVTGLPVEVLTFDEWADGERTVLCGAGVEVVPDTGFVRPGFVPITGRGSLIAGTWSPEGG